MSEFFEFTIAGIVSGSVYGMLALGIVLLMKGTKIPNFAQGAFGIVGAYVAWWLAVEQGVPFVFAVVLGVLAAGAVGGLTDRIALRPLLGAPVIPLVIVTLGINIILISLIELLWGSELRTQRQFFPGHLAHIGGVAVSFDSILILVLGLLIVVGLDLGFKRTNLGLAARATATDRTWPQYLGVNVVRVLSLNWIVAGMLAGLGGILVTGQLFLSPGVMESLLLASFTAAALGGFTSIWGAYGGGILLGLAQSWSAAYISTSSTQIAVFAVLFLVLMIRPAGLTRSTESRRV